MSMPFRIGFGYDVHQLAPGLTLTLGGVNIPHSKGCVAHSDGDVLIHAVCDALLGAAGKRDIGFHFPDTDSKYKGIDSRHLLAEVYNIITEAGYETGNIDVTVCLQKPKIAQYTDDMCKVLASEMHVDIGCISIKATTTEKLGFVGREEGIAVYAVALIFKREI
ncbi:MAG TPA: 2-C-methyl-D-erythritol 2,4-cyclodiphosphate synthase [Bacteroidales bacterium]|nr:2-C-methyl-D-erythritol 2,4-cyclodiphosphate synthase [Bacteroidales bacterium]